MEVPGAVTGEAGGRRPSDRGRQFGKEEVRATTSRTTAMGSSGETGGEVGRLSGSSDKQKPPEHERHNV